MRAARVRTIATFELRATVFRLGFLVTTFGLPLLLLAITGTSALLQAELVAAHVASSPSLGVVDLPGVLPELPLAPADGASLVRYPDQGEGLDALRRQRIDGLFVLSRTWMQSGEVLFVTRSDVSVLARDDARAPQVLAEALRRSLARGHAEESTVERLVSPVLVQRARLTPEGLAPESPEAIAEALAAVMVPMLLGILLMSALLMASGYLVQTIAQDKETKIVEVLLSSATAPELLAGKLLGLGAAGLLQFAVWAALGGSAGVAALALGPLAGVELPVTALATMPLFFLLGYAFLGSVMLASSAFGASAAEAQKLTVGWVLLAIVPLVVLPALLEAPHGTLGRVLSHVPFSAPIAMVVRLSVDADGVPAWELVAVVIEMLIWTYAALRIGARFFRVGLLLSGGFPGWRAVLAQARSDR